jgi:hypothetical protein
MMMDQKQNVLVFWSFCRALLPMDLVAEGIIPILIPMIFGKSLWKSQGDFKSN